MFAMVARKPVAGLAVGAGPINHMLRLVLKHQSAWRVEIAKIRVADRLFGSPPRLRLGRAQDCPNHRGREQNGLFFGHD